MGIFEYHFSEIVCGHIAFPSAVRRQHLFVMAAEVKLFLPLHPVIGGPGALREDLFLCPSSVAAEIIRDDALNGGQRRKPLTHRPVARDEGDVRPRTADLREQHRTVELHVTRR